MKCGVVVLFYFECGGFVVALVVFSFVCLVFFFLSVCEKELKFEWVGRGKNLERLVEEI